MAFDIASIDLEKEADGGSWVQLSDPRTNELIFADSKNKKPKADCSLNVIGVQSKVVQAKLAEIEKGREEREEQNYDQFIKEGIGHVKARRDSKSTADELAIDDAMLLAASTIGWRNLSFEGVEEFSEDLMFKFFYARQWAAKQAQRHIANHLNFMTEQEKS